VASKNFFMCFSISVACGDLSETKNAPRDR
jgi:hypothetical protein